MVETVLLRRLPYPKPERLVSLFELAPKKGIAHYFVASSDFWDWRDRSRTLEAFGGYWRHEVTVSEPGYRPEQIPGVAITASLARTLGLRPIAGRLFTHEDMRPGGPSVALITYDRWQRRYGGAHTAIGRSIGLNGSNVQIAGILTPGCTSPATHRSGMF